MAEVLTCPSCNRKLQVPDNLLGQDVQCPTCSATFLAQASGPVLPPIEPPLPLAPLDESPRSRRRDWGDDDYDDDDGRRRVRRRRRSDYEPHRGAMIMTLGILSFFIASFILGPMAWIMGNNDLKAMRAGRMDPEGESQTNTGRICGMISTIMTITLVVVGLLFFCFCVVAGMFSAANAPPPGRRF
jgi:hypothetical protein